MLDLTYRQYLGNQINIGYMSTWRLILNNAADGFSVSDRYSRCPGAIGLLMKPDGMKLGECKLSIFGNPVALILFNLNLVLALSKRISFVVSDSVEREILPTSCSSSRIEGSRRALGN